MPPELTAYFFALAFFAFFAFFTFFAFFAFLAIVTSSFAGALVPFVILLRLRDLGKGFLHEASNVCFGVTDLIQEKGDAHGYCVVTDKTNDKAFLVWKGFQGTYQWTGGTGQIPA